MYDSQPFLACKVLNLLKIKKKLPKFKKRLKMKNILMLTFTIICLCTISLHAQKQPTRLFKKGQADGYLTVGLVSTFFADHSKQKLLPLNIGADFMVGDNFSIGGTFGHSISETANVEFSGGEHGQLRNRYYEFAIKTGLHITKFDNMSIYGGFMLSYHLSNMQAIQGDLKKISYHSGIKSTQSKLMPGGYMGFKYAVKKKMTLMAEVGYGVSIVRMGVGYRFK